MRGYTDFENMAKAFSIVFIFMVLFMWINKTSGNITISVTGQPEIDKLSAWNIECNKRLDSKCDPCPKVICKETGVDQAAVMFFIGIFIGFLYFLMFGKETRKWLLRRLKDANNKR